MNADVATVVARLKTTYTLIERFNSVLHVELLRVLKRTLLSPKLRTAGQELDAVVVAIDALPEAERASALDVWFAVAWAYLDPAVRSDSGPLLAAPIFPAGRPDGVELVRIAATYFTDERDARPFVAPFGVDALALTPGLSALHMWREMLEHSAKAGTLRKLVRALRDKNPKGPFASNLERWLSEVPA